MPTVTLEDGAVKELTVTRTAPLANGSLAIQGFAGTEAWTRVWVLKGDKLESFGRAADLPPCPGIGQGRADSLSMYGELEGGAILCMAAERAMPLGLVAVKNGSASWLTWKGAPLAGGGTANPRLDHVDWRSGMRAGLYVVWTGADNPQRYMRVTAEGLTELFSPSRMLPGLEELGPVQLGSARERLTPDIDGWIVATVYPAKGPVAIVATNINTDAPQPVKADQAPPAPASP
jgi:hypothetical protein